MPNADAGLLPRLLLISATKLAHFFSNSALRSKVKLFFHSVSKVTYCFNSSGVNMSLTQECSSCCEPSAKPLKQV